MKKTLAAAILLTASASANAGPYSDGALKQYEFAYKQLEVYSGSTADKANSNARWLKEALKPQYLDYCLAWRGVVEAYRMEGNSERYQAWASHAKTPFNTTYIGVKFVDEYCN